MNKQIAIGLLCVGALLAAGSFVWPKPDPRNALTPDEYSKLEELDNKVVDLHLQMQKFENKGNESVSAEAQAGFDKVVAERDALRDKLESSIEGGGFARGLCRYLGIGLLIAGVGMNMATKQP